jgi:hypothetical protein
MFPFNKYILDNQDTQNDLSSQENIEQITNLPPPTISGTQIKNELKDDFYFSLNNKYLLTPLINNINNFNYFKENEKQTKVTDGKKKNEKVNIFNVKKNYINTNNSSYKTLDSKEFSEKNGRLGRKRKNDDTPGFHNKYSPDNILRKCKHIILNQLMEFINYKIKDIYNGNIGNSIFKKELLTLNKEQKFNSNVIYNQNFLSKNLGDIFSDDISTKYSNFFPDHNKRLIMSLKNEEDQNKKNYFEKLFNITYLQCINHFIGIQKVDELDGLKCFSQLKKEMNEEKEYIDCIEYFLMNYELITMKKRPRNRKKNRPNDISIFYLKKK